MGMGNCRESTHFREGNDMTETFIRRHVSAVKGSRWIQEKGFLIGHFGICRSPISHLSSSSWWVLHQPTGTLVSTFPTKKKAVTFSQALMQIPRAGWAEMDVEKFRKKKKLQGQVHELEKLYR